MNKQRNWQDNSLRILRSISKVLQRKYLRREAQLFDMFELLEKNLLYFFKKYLAIKFFLHHENTYIEKI